jgi:hypothetical protein
MSPSPDSGRPHRGVHPVAILPPIAATLLVAGDVATAQTTWVVGIAGVAAAEAVCRWRARADRSRARAGGPVVVAAVPILWAVVTLLVRPLLPASVSTGLLMGALASLTAAALLLLPLPTTQQLARRPARPRTGLGVPSRHV